MDALDENTKTAAVLAACEHARQDRRAKEKALEYPDMTPELAKVLSTQMVSLNYCVETKIDVVQS
ncbi:hypothetical protein PNQ29_13205 [Halobacterium salinarum]|uniref:DUF7692 domain-containing protein n=4 Tax=Halobacterium salinarum TaxID=2242 RepID=Q9HRN8_HALSA|nr:hypothetical protein [Halobacterium salinarum]AAG19120.1 hypothetical protein VNG_0612H [Halobacterium salinarum NRC-1]MBB6089962.1 hypothetical protein [Halobacterium salinarum]MDL0120678.1 hypothetical protein [Halobacterium salinarum]MDL0123911.1 hypothetical protein [Halobacterium salinarum]MDL0130555.1 hypothetical protein [Halobacterium salinarum]